MKKNFKRWLAFLLAVVLVATSGMFRSESFLQATDESNLSGQPADDATLLEITGEQPANETVVIPIDPPADTSITENPSTTENPEGQPDVPPVTTENLEGQPADTQVEEPVVDTPEEPTVETTTETQAPETTETQAPEESETVETPIQANPAADAAGADEPVESEKLTSEEPEAEEPTDPEEQADEVPIPETILVTVNYKNADGNLNEQSGEKEVSLANLTNDPLPVEGYAYSKTTYGDISISGVEAHVVDDEVVYYVMYEAGDITGIQIDKTTDIVVLYEEVNNVNVTYDVRGVEDSNAAVAYEGVTNTKKGESFNFSVKANMGYTVTKVVATCGSDSREIASADGVYVVPAEMVTGDVAVEIQAEKIESYKIDFGGDNTIFEFNGAKGGAALSGRYLNDGTPVSFMLSGSRQNESGSWNEKVLNKLAITLNGKTGTVDIPNIKGESKTTKFTDEIEVTVKYESDTKMQYDLWTDNKNLTCIAPKYIVTIKGINDGNPHGDIRVETNYKSSKRYEVWPQQLTGVTLLIGENVKSLEPLDPATGDSVRRSKSTGLFMEDYWVYIKVQDGYSSDKLEDIILTVTGDGGLDITKSFKLQPCNANEKTYGDFKFVIPKSNENRDIRISVSSKPIERNFNVTYNYNGGTDANGSDTLYEDPKTYHIGDTFAVTDGKGVPQNTGYVFAGWELNGKTYNQGSIFAINESTAADASNSKYEFIAKWVPNGEAKKIPYNIDVYFADEDGQYNTKYATIVAYGPQGETVSVIGSSLNTYLQSVKDNLPENWDTDYVVDRANTNASITLEAGTTQTIRISYKKNEYSYTVKYVDANGQAVATELKSQTGYKSGSTIETISPAEVSGYYLDSWEVSDPAQSGKFTADTGAFVGGVMPIGGLTITYKYIRRHEVTVTAESLETTYNGKEQSVSGFKGETDKGIPVTVTEGDQTVTYYVTGLVSDASAKDANVDENGNGIQIPVKKASNLNTEFVPETGKASVDVTSAVTVTDKDGKNVTRQFKVFAVPGTLKIAKAPLTLESASLSKVYDGTPLRNSDLEEKGVTVTYQAGSDKTKANSVGIIATGWVNDGEGTDVAYEFTNSVLVPGADVVLNEFKYTATATNLKNYKITEVYGKLTITDRGGTDAPKYSVTVTANSLNEVYYNGNNQTANGFANQTDKGIEVKVQVNGEDVIYYVQGLNSSATQKDATIEKDGDTVVVKGIPVPVTGTDADGNTVTLTPAEGKDTVDATAIATIYDEKGNDVTAQFKKVTVNTGTLTIQQKPLTLVSASLKKEYDGTPLSNDNRSDEGVTSKYPDDVKGTLDVSSGVYEDGWIDGEGATYTFANNVTLATEWKTNEFEAIPNQGTNLDNYAITKVEGQLSVVNRSDKNKYNVTITPNSAKVTYDGTEKSVSGFVGQTKVNDEIRIPLKDGGYYVTGITAGATGTDAKKYPVTTKGTVVVKDVNGNDVTAQFNVKIAEVNLEIEKRAITVKPDTRDPKPYNGQAQTADGCLITEGSLAAGHSVSAEFEGSQKLVNKLASWPTTNISIKDDTVVIRDADLQIVTDNYTIVTEKALLKVTDVGVKAEDIIIKTHTPKDGGYTVGDTVRFKITVTNMYNSPATVHLEEKDGVEFETGVNIFDNKTIPTDGKTEIWATYTITEEDILAGKFENTVTVRFARDIANGKTYQATDTVKVAQPTATLDVTMVPEKTLGYDLNDKVTYTVTVTNTGNLTLAPGTRVTVDKGTVPGDTPAVYTITEALAPGAEAAFTVTYDVTEADIRAGQIVNKATAEGTIDSKSYNDLVQTVYPTNRVIGVSSDVTVKTADPKPQIVLTKDIVSITDANGNGKSKDELVNIGDVITYEISAKNTGNIALKNVVIEDKLTGNTVENGTALQSIQYGFGPGAELRLLDDTVTYTVTEADIVAGKVINRATVVKDGITDLDGNPVPSEDIVVEDGVKEIGTQQQEPSLGMIIERAPVNPDDPDSAPDNSIVGLNDEVNYIIRVTNNGNVTIENIKVTDVLTGNVEDEELEIASLAPGESAELPVTYSPVTEDDILAGSIVNQASAVGTNANKETETVTVNAEHTATTAAVSTAYTVTRTLTDPQDLYRVGETIRYTITIASQANVSLNNVVVSDLLEGAAGNVTFTGMTTTAADGTEDQADTVPVNAANEVVIDSLQPGSMVTLTCEYTVVRADAGTNNTIVGTTNVKADSVWTTGKDVVENKVAEMTSAADPAPVENIYNLTIHYVYAQGGQAAPDVTAQYLEGETFTYTTPAIDGYTPDFRTVGSGANGMLARDVEVTVVYTAIPATLPTNPGETPTTPGGTTGTPGTPYTPGTPIIMGEPQVTPVVADAVAAAVPAAATVTTVAAAAPEGEDPVDIEDNEVPLVQPEDGQITEDENGDVDLVPVEDEEVPLANTVIDEHVFCILHYLLLLLTVILSICYAISLKKQQKRLVILQKGYDEEMRNR